MKATELAFFFVVVNLAIFLVNQISVFDPQIAMGGEADLEKQLPWWYRAQSGELVAEGGGTLDELIGLAKILISGIAMFTDIVTGMLTGIGDLVARAGISSPIPSVINAIVWIIYAFAIIELRTGRTSV